jgi:multiple sugar transport system ATP-binding protein
MAGVTLEQVTRTFRTRRGEVRAIDDLSLSVGDGEFIVLVGPSGCGKTTTLRLIAGLEELTAGTIRIGDRVVNRVAPKDRDVAMVFQNYALYPHMTVYKNMAFGLKMRRVPKVEIKRKVGEVAEKLGLTQLLDRKPASLSGGECQRVAVGRAIVRKPQVFLFDEPLSNLDAGLRTQMRTELKDLHRELRTTVVYVTHDQEEAMTLGDRMVVLKEGVVQQCGTPLEVYNRPANRFVAAFIGTPPMNFFDGRVECSDGAVCFAGRIGRIFLPQSMSDPMGPTRGQAAVFGIRPQHVLLNGGPLSSDTGARIVIGEATVRHLEPLGDCINVHLRTVGGESIVARVSPTTAVSPSQAVSVGLDLSNAHVFSTDDGRRLGAQ